MGTSILHIKSEIECKVFLFDEEKGIITPEKYFNIKVSKGRYELSFTSVVDEQWKYKTFYVVEDGYENIWIEIKQSYFTPHIIGAEQGNPEAQFSVGYRYYKGKGVEQNYDEAMKWFRKAAEHGYAKAQNCIGIMYFKGKGVEQSNEKALSWFRKAAEQGYSIAQCNIGYMYDKGKGVEKNLAEAIKWYKKSAGQGHSVAQLYIGNMCYEGRGLEQDDAEAVKWYGKAVEQGNAVAQYNLGNMYYTGKGVAKNYAKAVDFFSLAAEQGVAFAQNNLGVCYDCGNGVAQDFAIAEKWYRKAAAQRCDRAQYNLGRLYKYHRGVERVGNEEESMKWYCMAAEQGLPEAQYRYGRIFESGIVEIGLERNYVEAVKWYKKAAEQGDPIAQCELSHMYEFGHGVEKDYAEAVKWICKSAELGYGTAMFKINFTFRRMMTDWEYESVKKKYDNGSGPSVDFDFPLVCDNQKYWRKYDKIKKHDTKELDNLHEEKICYANYDVSELKIDNGYYTIVRTPLKGCIVWPYRCKTIARRGFEEQSFENEMRRVLPTTVKVLGDVNILPQNGVRPYEPDIAIVYSEKNLNVRIDVEIDEPYAAITNKPTHYIGCGDEYRDANLNCLGWIVVRFSERQVKLHSKQCIRFIADVLKNIDKAFLMPVELDGIPPVAPEKQWTLIEAQKMAKEQVRQAYLKHEFGKTEVGSYDESDLKLTSFEESIKSEVHYVIPSATSQSAIPASDEDFVDDNNLGYNKDNAIEYDSHISFNGSHHIYTVDGIPYKAVSNVISELFPVFDKEYWAARKGAERGVDSKQVLEEWDVKGQKSREVGTFMHQQIENHFLGRSLKYIYPFRYEGTFVRECVNVDIHREISFFNNFLKHVPIAPFRTEWRIFDRSLRIAGTIDLICKNGNQYDIYDWKRSAKLHEDKVYGYGLGELSHLEDWPINHYKLQQNLYRYILEHQYGLRVRSMNLVVLHPDNPNYEIIPVERMDKEVKAIIRMQ